MYTKNVIIENKTGLHARPAAMFVQAAGKYKSSISIERGEKKGNAKSILSVLSLGIVQGTEIVLSADGEDEKAAVDALVELIQSKFGEE